MLLLAFLLAFVTIIFPTIVGAVPLTVLSDSMAPSMPVGSLAVVRPTKGTVPAEDLVVKAPDAIRALNDVSGIGPGDVIAFKPHPGDPLLVMHRVRAVETNVHAASGQVRTTFTTRGDNLRVDDDPVMDYQVRGVVMYSLPLLGYVNDAVNTGPNAARSAVAVVVAGYGIAVVFLLRAAGPRGARV
jgi:signal peptidase